MDAVQKKQEHIDYFKWYSDEITRYRDYEWKNVTYSISMSWAVVGFWLLKDFERKNDLRYVIAGALGYFVLLLLISSIHIHQRLNSFRWRRSAFERGECEHKVTPASACGLKVIWAQEGIDWFYILFFFVSPIFMYGISFFVLFYY